MGEFIKHVQADAVPGPLRRAFTKKRWASEFDSCSDVDEIDRNLYAAGIVIHEKLQTIRAHLRVSTSQTLSATTKLRAFVAAINHTFLVTRERSLVAIAKLGHERTQQNPEGFRIEELAAVKLELPGGFEWSPQEIIEGAVDGIEIPVRFALTPSPELSGNPKMDQVEWGEISLELNLGTFYHHLEDLWNDCLWNGYVLRDSDTTKTFHPRSFDLIRGHAMGLARRLSLSIGFTTMAMKYHKELVAQKKLPPMREVHAIERQGKRQVIKLTTPDTPSKAQEELLIARALAAEPYYAEILHEPRLLLSGQSVFILLNAWSVTSRASAILMESVIEKHTNNIALEKAAHTWLPGYAPVLQIEAITQAISSVTNATRVQAKSLVDFLTFRGQPGQEIWAQPLLPVGPSTVAPVFGAMTSPNLRRVIDVWLRQLGVDLSVRGPAFETHVRTLVGDGIAESKLLAGKAWSPKDGYKLNLTEGRSEQIDLLIVIGSTVILAEVKCILEPTDAKAVAMHRKTVHGAADQARRKSQALRDNRARFIDDMKRLVGCALAQEFKVVPIVVVSTSTHVGVSADGIPVVDEYILGRFLDGELEDVGVSGEDLSVQKTLKTIFYTSVPEAEAVAERYFNAPPQLERFRKGLQGRVIPLHAINEHDWQGFSITLDCTPQDQPPAHNTVIFG